MEDYLFTNKDYDLWVLLSVTRRAILKARQRELRRYQISPRQSAIIIFAQALGGMATLGEIAQWLLIEPHTVSNVVTRMERQGLVRKDKDPDRKSVIRVVLTKKGHEGYYQSTKIESTSRIMSSLSKGECQQLRSCLQKLLRKAVEELKMEYHKPLPPSQRAMGEKVDKHESSSL